jgi:hypothetical protein
MLLGSFFNDVLYLLLKGLGVLVLVHFVQNFCPDPILDLTILCLLQIRLNVLLRFQGKLVLINDFYEFDKRFFDMHLNQSKLLIALILENFRKKCHLMILPQIGFDSVDDRSGPLHNQRLQPILLIQVRIHVLLHRFLGRSRLLTFLVETHLLRIHILYRILQLLQRQNSCLGSKEACATALSCRLWLLLASLGPLLGALCCVATLLLLLELLLQFAYFALISITFLRFFPLAHLGFVKYRFQTFNLGLTLLELLGLKVPITL